MINHRTFITRDQVKGGDGCYLPVRFQLIEPKTDAAEVMGLIDAIVKIDERCEAAEKLAYRRGLYAIAVTVAWLWVVLT